MTLRNCLFTAILLAAVFAGSPANAGSIRCHVQNVLHEAGGEGETGMVAVAAVVIERQRDRRWPATACDVIHQPQQFSWTADERREFPRWLRHKARKAVLKALAGRNPCPGATHYHSTRIDPPVWTKALHRACVIRGHVFYTEGPPARTKRAAAIVRKAASQRLARPRGRMLQIVFR